MADLQLDDLSRARLDDIVQRAHQNGETDENIQNIVNDFKSKYGKTASFVQNHPYISGALSKIPEIALSMAPGVSPKSYTDSTISKMADSLPILGSFFGPEGTVAGSAARLAIKPQEVQTPTDIPLQIGKDVALNNVAPNLAGRGISKLLSLNPKGLLGSLLKLSPGANQALETSEAAAQNGKIQQILEKPQSPVNSSNVPNTPEELNQYWQAQKQSDTLNNLFSKGYSPTTGAFDASKIIKELDSNASSYVSVPDEVRSFLTTAADQQASKVSTSGNLLRSAKNRLILSSLPVAVAGVATGHTAATATTGGTLLLGESAIKQILKDPQLANLATQAMKTPASSESSQFLTKSLIQGLKGTNLILRSKDDSDVPVTIGPNGEMQPSSPKN